MNPTYIHKKTNLSHQQLLVPQFNERVSIGEAPYKPAKEGSF